MHLMYHWSGALLTLTLYLDYYLTDHHHYCLRIEQDIK